jgi:hypothetical protein
MNQGKNRRRTSGLTTSFTLWLVPKRGDIRSHRRAEEFWSDRVKTARSKYEIADVRPRQIMASQKKWPVVEPDGSALVRAARLEELAARNEYVHALRVFTELMLHGEMPE